MEIKLFCKKCGKELERVEVEAYNVLTGVKTIEIEYSCPEFKNPDRTFGHDSMFEETARLVYKRLTGAK